MNFFKKVSVISFSLIAFNSLNIFAYVPAFVSANSSGNLNIEKTSIISANKNGEIISKLSENSSLFQLSLSSENQYTTGQYAKIINNDNAPVYVYEQPSNQSKILGELQSDSAILINSIEDNFARILFNDSIGYIDIKNTKTTGIIEKEKEKEKTPPAKDDNKNQQNKKVFAKIISENGLNFRKAPSTDSPVLSKLPFNSYVDVLEIENDWLKVSKDGQVGFISSDFAKITDVKEQSISNTKTKGEEIVEFAKKYLGKPYIYGSTNLERGTDCSGFTYSVFKHFGVNINRVSRDQFLNGTPVDKNELKAGDLVFFNTGGNSRISHVGIYISNGQYIHCTDAKGQGVIISSLNSPYSSRTYYGARRIVK